MCGIGGIVHAHEDEPVCLEAMTRLLSMLEHRGPDGYGLYRSKRVALGHTRLSIIDLDGGAQPLTNEDKTLWLTFNGEIFNYIELRQELRSLGHSFSTETDSEVVLHAFEEWGEQAWLRFNGQFAFALWDERKQDLWLVRDPFGILPLHYTRGPRGFAFASEAKALFASGFVDVEFDALGLAEVFNHWSVRSPRTVFAGVCTVPPGTALRLDREQTLHTRRYWRSDLTPRSDLRNISNDEAAEALHCALSRAVKLRLRADVPVGAYLSGGLDSSVIAQMVRGVSGDKLETFAVRFEDAHFDETKYQRTMSARLHTEHHEVLCGDTDLRDALPEVIWHAETSLLRTGPVPLFLLSGLVRRAQRKVVLTGEGADELFAGYNIFKEDRIRRFWARQPESKMRPALLQRLYPYVARGRGGAMWRAFFRRGMEDLEDPFYSHRIRWRNAQAFTSLLSPQLRASVETNSIEAGLAADLPSAFKSWSPLARAQFLEVETFMSSYLLASQGDRVAMGHGVEARYPFLDPDVVALANALPDRVKLQGLNDKRVLRRVGSAVLPQEIWDRPKQPYRAPMTQPFFGPGRPEYCDALMSEDALRDSALIDPAPARRLYAKAVANQGVVTSAKEEMALVAVLSTQLLAKAFVTDFRDEVERAYGRIQRASPAVFVDRCRA